MIRAMVTLTPIKKDFPAAANYHALYRVTEPSVGLEAYVALHDLSRGPGFGGIRRMSYPSADHAVTDALRLSEHMTLKTQLANLPCGGAKAVILNHSKMDLPAAYQAFGEAVQALGGDYFCGPDVGTGEDEMSAVRAGTQYANPPSNRPSESTARGILCGIDALIEFAGPIRTALVQGVGRVGARVALGLSERCDGIAISDPVDEAIAQLKSTLSAAVVVAPQSALNHPCALLSPCAVGPVVTPANVNSLPVQMICGAANNQLELPFLAERLHERGVLYIPDVVVNSGAVIEGVLTLLRPGDDLRARINDAIDAIQGRVLRLLMDAQSQSCSPLRVALGHTLA